ncbi:probable E3 ubiquitin-protein ligase RHA4A [Argentina anserina]|uniref:probable E3 ubiquitin-protein ligase RHA4A n=1 Tax=Argentina anserina TaxID=57926 RepID=UPI0021763B00|nr:probable E3 ubiquitin-protein ligase RHA4A [Potentilla anserina]
MGGYFRSYDIRWQARCMLKIKSLVLLLCGLLEFLLKKIDYCPELFFNQTVGDQQNEEDCDHQLEVLNFEAATIPDTTWLRFLQVPAVPVVIDTESIKKQLPVVQFQELYLKQRQLQATSSSSSEEKTHISSCIMCMNSIEGRDEIRELCNCQHVFHKECLDAWIDQAQLTCPLCRSELLVPVTTSAISLKHDKDGGSDPWRAERMIYLFGEDICFTS